MSLYVIFFFLQILNLNKTKCRQETLDAIFVSQGYFAYNWAVAHMNISGEAVMNFASFYLQPFAFQQ